MDFGLILDVVMTLLLGIVAARGLYGAIRALVRQKPGFGVWLGRWRQLIILIVCVYGAYACYTDSAEDMRRYEDFMAHGVPVEASVISTIHNQGSRRNGRFTNVILYRTEAGTPYYHRERARFRRECQDKITLRYKRDNPQEVLIMEYHTSALNAQFRRALSCILGSLAAVVLVMLWSCRKP